MLAGQDGKVAFPLRQVKEHAGVTPPGLPVLVRLGEAAGGVLADGLQQPEARPARGRLGDGERFGCQPVHDIQRRRLVPAAAHTAAAVSPKSPANTDSSRNTRASCADNSS